MYSLTRYVVLSLGGFAIAAALLLSSSSEGGTRELASVEASALYGADSGCGVASPGAIACNCPGVVTYTTVISGIGNAKINSNYTCYYTPSGWITSISCGSGQGFCGCL